MNGEWYIQGQEEISLQTVSWKSFVKLLPKRDFYAFSKDKKMERQKGRKAKRTWEGGRKGARERKRKYGCEYNNQSS